MPWECQTKLTNDPSTASVNRSAQWVTLSRQLRLTAPDAVLLGVRRINLPRDKLELRLRTIWREVLGLISVGTQDDPFFGAAPQSRSRAVRALREYTPQVYPDRLTLFRARMQPLFSSRKPDKGWGRLAAGGLDSSWQSPGDAPRTSRSSSGSRASGVPGASADSRRKGEISLVT